MTMRLINLIEKNDATRTITVLVVVVVLMALAEVGAKILHM